MRSEDVRFVWLFVFFDLPVGTKPDRRWATRFGKFLKDDGFMMLQLSVYARACAAVRMRPKNTPSAWPRTCCPKAACVRFR